MSVDVLVKGGIIVDGTGRAPYQADLVIENGRISDIGLFEFLPDAPIIDASGLTVSPGFIDIHSHSDFTLLVDPRSMSSITQGVTLELVGNCGHGCAPISDADSVTSNIYGYQRGHELGWSTMAEYLDLLQGQQPAINIASLTPNGNLRLACVERADRPAHPDELRCMKKLLAQTLEEGSFGFSTGLEYALERDCSEDEILELAKVAAGRGRLYATHTRNVYGKPNEAIREAIRTSTDAGVPLQISHITVVSRFSEHPREATEDALAQVDEARRRGLNVAFDVHTRLFGTTNLSAILPSWALMGGHNEIATRLRDDDVRQKLKCLPNIVTTLAAGDWQRIVVFASEKQPEIAGRSIAEISQLAGTDPLDTIYDLLLAEGDNMHGLMVLAFTYTPEALEIAVRHPLCMIGSDATTLATNGPLEKQTFHGAYTWVAWFFRHFVRDMKKLSLEEAVRRVTSLPASRISLGDRGVIRKGAWADLAVFDTSRFAETGTTFLPNQLATGMIHVFVNGAIALHNGQLTGTRRGQVLRPS